jgi:hypothetical protein
MDNDFDFANFTLQIGSITFSLLIAIKVLTLRAWDNSNGLRKPGKDYGQYGEDGMKVETSLFSKVVLCIPSHYLFRSSSLFNYRYWCISQCRIR